MKRRSKQQDRSLTESAPPRHFEPPVSPQVALYQQFREQFPKWGPWLDGDDPVYALPYALTEFLMRDPHTEGGNVRPKRPLLAAEDAEVELAFSTMCIARHPHAVGIWRRSTIAHWPLATAYKLLPGSPSESNLRIHPYDFVRLAATEGVWNIGDEEKVYRLQEEFRHGVVECLGNFMFEPTASSRFRQDLKPVILHWLGLPPELQVPIRRIGIQDLQALRKCDNRRTTISIANDFSMAWDRLLSRWGLAGFVTWDLPVIPPPMLGEQLLVVEQALPKDAVVNFWPPQIQCPSEIVLNEVIFAQQREFPLVVPNWLGEDTSARRGPFFPRARGTRRNGSLSNFEKVMLMHVAEMAVRQRYGAAPAMASRLCEGYMEWFNFQSLQVVKNHRKHYLKYLLLGPTPSSKRRG